MIVCLGWGSLIWNPEELPVTGVWHNDGPNLPVEFLRQSNDGRLTLVIDAQSKPLPVLWAKLEVCNLDDAIEKLRAREGTNCQNIGRWPESSGYECCDEIQRWAESKEISGVVWTALGPKFNDKSGSRPSLCEALDYLSNMCEEKKGRAKEYIEKAPPQIDTVYRRQIIKTLGWNTAREHST